MAVLDDEATGTVYIASAGALPGDDGVLTFSVSPRPAPNAQVQAYDHVFPRDKWSTGGRFREIGIGRRDRFREPTAIAIMELDVPLFAIGYKTGGTILLTAIQDQKRRNCRDGEYDENTANVHVTYPLHTGTEDGIYQYPVTCLQYQCHNTRLAALYNIQESHNVRRDRSGSEIRVIDVQEYCGGVDLDAANMGEILEQYALCTITEALDWAGNVYMAGSVKVQQSSMAPEYPCDTCRTGPRSILPLSLCTHQHRSSQAALVTFDARAGHRPGSMVDRVALPHRSLYPRITVMSNRSHLLLSSSTHPIAIWDRRRMAGPVATPEVSMEQPVKEGGEWNFTKKFENYANRGEEERRVGPKEDLLVTQAMFLSAFGCMVAGARYDGRIGVWDLSSIFGYEERERAAEAMWEGEEGEDKEWDEEDEEKEAEDFCVTWPGPQTWRMDPPSPATATITTTTRITTTNTTTPSVPRVAADFAGKESDNAFLKHKNGKPVHTDTWGQYMRDLQDRAEDQEGDTRLYVSQPGVWIGRDWLVHKATSGRWRSVDGVISRLGHG